jgi:hypothetical protein
MVTIDGLMNRVFGGLETIMVIITVFSIIEKN